MIRLLNKPLKSFIIFTCIVLACSIPAYFYLVEYIWIGELDDHNQHLKEQIRQHFKESDKEKLNQKIALWNEMQVNSSISVTETLRADSLYFIEKEVVENGKAEMERFRALYSVISVNTNLYAVRVETNIEEVHETILAIAVVTAMFILLLIAGFMILNRRLSKQIWQPFTETLKKLKAFDLNSANQIDFSTTDILEFHELNEVLEKLIRNNISIYNKQKEFAQNASHELQTPLALLKTKIDLLIQDPVLTPEQRKILESLDNSVSRVTRINKNLLLLAGIENKSYESKNVDLSDMVNELALNLKEFGESKNCTFSIQVETGITLETNESLLEILVSNLFSNAVRHSSDGAAISVSLKDRVLQVSNDGKTPLLEGNLFHRFTSASSENPGTGLGLAIVKEITEKYAWKIAYSFEASRHTFVVRFF